MKVRAAGHAGFFYPRTSRACAALIDECLAAVPEEAEPGGEVLGGIVPHAGWVYSGAVAAATFRAVGEPAPRTFVLFGAVHDAFITGPALSPDDAWETPFGEVAVDRELAARVLAEVGPRLAEDRAAHRREHSLEVQVPFLARLFPGARILPVAMPPGPEAVELGEAVGRVLAREEDRIVVLGSTDLTHYGPRYGHMPRGTGPEAHRYAKEVSDRSFLDRLLALDAAGALEDARRKRNACGAGAAAAAAAACRALGASRARLLVHVTSHEVRPQGSVPSDFVGYASLVFLR